MKSKFVYLFHSVSGNNAHKDRKNKKNEKQRNKSTTNKNTKKQYNIQQIGTEQTPYNCHTMRFKLKFKQSNWVK